MNIYCPLSEALGIDPGEFSILDIKDYAHENSIVPGIRKGILHTDETKKLMSESRYKHLENNPGPMKDKIHSEETKKKMKTSRLKYLDTSEGKKQKEIWMKSGQVWTDGRKAEQSIRTKLLNQDPEKIRKTAEKNRGQKRSVETRAKISEARKRYYQTLKNGE